MTFEERQKAIEEILSVEIVLQEKHKQMLDAVSSLVELCKSSDRYFEQFMSYCITKKSKPLTFEESNIDKS